MNEALSQLVMVFFDNGNEILNTFKETISKMVNDFIFETFYTSGLRCEVPPSIPNCVVAERISWVTNLTAHLC